MPATSASHIIWFIVSVLVAASAVAALTVVITNVSEALKNRADNMAGELKADIEIINDPWAVPYNQTSNKLFLYVKNVGQTVLNQNSTLVFLNGSMFPKSAISITVTDGGVEWRPRSTIQIVLSFSSSTLPTRLYAGVDYRLKIDVGDVNTMASISDTMDFRVRVFN